MRRAPRWLLALFLALSATALPAPGHAGGRDKASWKKIEAPAGEHHDRLVRLLKPLLQSATRKADFGKSKGVVLHARILSWSSFTQGDVHRVSCTLVGRIQGGPTARSRISFGGRPSERAALEKQVLTMVANGVVTRLAEIAKAQAAEAAEQKKRQKEEAEEDGGT